MEAAQINNQEISETQDDSLPSRDRIVQLQESMLPFECEQPEPNHYFAPGMYCRELTVPANMLMVGKIHKHAHFLLVLKGKALVISEFGRDIVEAGHISVSQPGVKRVVQAIEDTQFVTIHVNASDTEDLEIIEAEHIEPEDLQLMRDQVKEMLK